VEIVQTIKNAWKEVQLCPAVTLQRVVYEREHFIEVKDTKKQAIKKK